MLVAAITARNLTRVYPNGVTALQDVTFTVDEGEMVGILGASGAGKTTLFRLLNGSIRPSAGSLAVLGVALDHASPSTLRRVRRQVASIYQNHNLLPAMSVAHNVYLGRLGHLSRGQTLRSLFFLTGAERSQIHHVLEELAMDDKMGDRADELSGGQSQRVAVARALFAAPRLVLADEPVASVDEATAMTIMTALQRLNQAGATILVNLHQVDLARCFCRRLLVFAAGRLVFDGPGEKLDRRELYLERGRLSAG